MTAAPSPASKNSEYRNRVLELLMTGAPLKEVLETLLDGLEQQRPGALCSLMLLDASGQRFTQVFAPSLPDFFRGALIGQVIGPGKGSCGSAAYSEEMLVVEDIASHPFWADYKDLAAQAGLAACWSMPVQSASGRVLGTFAIYYREPRAPDTAELAMIQQSAALACIAIERDAEARQLRDSEARYRTLVEFLPVGIIVHQDLKIVYANPSAASILGAASGEAMLGTPILDITHESHWKSTHQRIKSREDGVDPPPLEIKLVKLDGTVIDVHMHATLIQYAGANAVQASFTDITEYKRANEKLELSANVFSHAREGILITDAETRIVDANKAFTTITGYSRDEVMGVQARIFRSGKHSDGYYEEMWRNLNARGHWSGEIWSQRKNGEDYAEMITISAVTDDNGMVRNYVVLQFDITPMKAYQKQLEDMAHFDALTHLPNRLLLADRLRQAMSHSQRRKLTLAVVFLDLDGFKAVNDQYGHDVGDELLIDLSQRMKGALRDGDTLARIGGDEFVAVLVDLQHPEDAEPVLERLLQAAADPITVGEALIQVSASMGIAVYPRDGTHVDLLLRRADQSMYLAKQAGRNRFHFFDEGGEG